MSGVMFETTSPVGTTYLKQLVYMRLFIFRLGGLLQNLIVIFRSVQPLVQFGMNVVFLLPEKILLVRYIGGIPVPFAQLSARCGETRCSGIDLARPPIRGG